MAKRDKKPINPHDAHCAEMKAHEAAGSVVVSGNVIVTPDELAQHTDEDGHIDTDALDALLLTKAENVTASLVASARTLIERRQPKHKKE